MIKLYDYALSGNCFKVRLLLDWLSLEYEKQLVDFYPGLEHRDDAFLAINPLGQLPVIDDDGEIIRDAQAILVHLDCKYDAGGNWYPTGHPDLPGKIQQWLAFADGLTGSISAARLHDAMFFELDVEEARARGEQLLRILEEHLWFAEAEGNSWLCTADNPTIADIACFPYVALAEEGGIDMAPYSTIHRWLERFMRIKGFHPMAGMMPLPMPGTDL